MDIKTVGLDREAYDALRREKKPGESFSEVVKRLTRKRRPLFEFAGRWKAVPRSEVKEFESAIRAVRQADLEQAGRVLKRVEVRDEGR
jgi:predicted CopG family antitoxin